MREVFAFAFVLVFLFLLYAVYVSTFVFFQVQEKRRERFRQLEELFNAADEDNSGSLTLDELHAVLEKPEVSAWVFRDFSAPVDKVKVDANFQVM